MLNVNKLSEINCCLILLRKNVYISGVYKYVSGWVNSNINYQINADLFDMVEQDIISKK
jgi:hypothetical protein